MCNGLSFGRHQNGHHGRSSLGLVPRCADPLQRTARVLVLFLLYGAVMVSLGQWVVDEEMIILSGVAELSSDVIMTLVSVSLVVAAEPGGVRRGHVVPSVVGWVSTSSGGGRSRCSRSTCASM